ncbi:MAG: hypothetical protein PUC41_00005, partial [Oscillospiraceae bacterium]|nr:hypothetical protein [Oscillospiraceae bacterium]
MVNVASREATSHSKELARKFFEKNRKKHLTNALRCDTIDIAASKGASRYGKGTLKIEQCFTRKTL